MKKQLLLLTLALYSILCHAQNYQCIQNGVKHYFINGQNYLRGISIDSVHTFGDTTVYYPYQVNRGFGWGSTYVDTITGGWLGKKVTQLPDGTFLFDNAWGDTVTVKTQAAPGDSWLFYTDTTNHTYIATLTAIDTMAILDTLDSVKIITIQSYHDGQNSTNDPLNGYQLILSKRNGFARAFDLYTFPYYLHSGDVFQDRYTTVGGTTPFNIVDYHNPTSLEMYGGLNVGDMFAGNYSTQMNCTNEAETEYEHYDSIVAKIVIDSSHTNFAIHHIVNGDNYNPNGPNNTYYYQPFAYDYFDTLHADTSVIFLNYMPEQSPVSLYGYFYYPSDNSFCHNSPYYKTTIPWLFEGCPSEADFKKGFLPINSTYCVSLGCMDEIGYDELITDVMFYALVNDSSCNGVILPALSTKILLSSDEIKISPNPTQNELNISAPQDIHQVVVYNVLGQTMYSQQFNSEKVQLDVSGLAAGMYFLKVNGAAVQKFVKQ